MAAITSFSGENLFLSNFYPATIYYKGEKYKTLEHAYQAAKTSDPIVRERIRFTTTPRKAKALGRNIPDLPEDWDDQRLVVMTYLVTQKFQDVRLAIHLLKTKPHELIEGNWWGDTFWGQCNGKGENWLGRILMMVRDNLHFRKDLRKWTE